MKALKTILFLYGISRVILFGFLAIGQPDMVHYADNQPKLDNPILDRFVLYDSDNYAQIASGGYTEDRLTAFFPLFPVLVRAFAGLGGIGVYWAGFVLSNFFFVCSLWLLYQIMGRRGLSERVRIVTLSALAFFPSSYFFSAFYTESFFLFLALLAFRLWENEKRGAAYFIGGLASLTRIVGVWVPLAFFIERLLRRKLNVKDFAYAFTSALMFSLYPAYLWLTKGNPLLFLKVQAPFYGRLSTIPFTPIYRDIVTSIETGKIEPIIVFHWILMAIFLGYVIATIRQRYLGMAVSWSEFVYTVGLVIIPLSSMSIQAIQIPSHGFMRYFLTVFPLFIFLGTMLDKVMIRANKNSGHALYPFWKSVAYTVLFIWVFISIYIFSILRFKGFVA